VRVSKKKKERQIDMLVKTNPRIGDLSGIGERERERERNERTL
jgi:hypothetical protein